MTRVRNRTSCPSQDRIDKEWIRLAKCYQKLMQQTARQTKAHTEKAR